MSKENTPKYTTVSEASVTKIVESAKGQAQGQRKARNNEGKCWATTVLWLHAKMPLDQYDETQEIKDIAEDIRDTFKNNFLVERDEEIGELDSESEGKNARTGKTMAILDKDGQPKWSSWEETKLPIAYCGDIARIVKAGIVDDVVNEAKSKVMGRTDALKRAKTPEAALDTIERSIKLIKDKYTDLGDADLLKALTMVDDLFTAMDSASKSVEPVAKAA